MVLLSACGFQHPYVSPRLLKRLGCQARTTSACPRLFASTSEYSRLRAPWSARPGGWLGSPAMRGNTLLGGDLRAPHENRRRAGDLIWCYDISRRKAMEQELRLLASTDTLTGLHNRHSFLHQAELMLKAAERFRHPCVALIAWTSTTSRTSRQPRPPDRRPRPATCRRDPARACASGPARSPGRRGILEDERGLAYFYRLMSIIMVS